MVLNTILLSFTLAAPQAEFHEYPWTQPIVQGFGIELPHPQATGKFDFFGQVLDQNSNAPIGDVVIEWNGRKFNSDNEGRFNFMVNQQDRALPPLPYATVFSNDRGLKTFLPVSGFESKNDAAIFFMDQGASLDLTLSKRGTPVSNALIYPVYLLGDVLPGTLSPKLHRRSDANGHATLSNIPASAFFQIYVREESGHSMLLPGQFLLDAGQNSKLNFDLAEIKANAPLVASNSEWIDGTVLGSSGTPVSDVLIFASWGENGQAITRSDSGGNFRLKGLPNQQVEVSAIQRGGTQLAKSVLIVPGPDVRINIGVPNTTSIQLNQAATMPAASKHSITGRLHAGDSGFTSNHNWPAGENLSFEVIPGRYSYYLSRSDGKVAFGSFDTKSKENSWYNWLPARTMDFIAPGEEGTISIRFTHNNQRVIEVSVKARERFRLRLPLGSLAVSARSGAEIIASANLELSPTSQAIFKFER